MSKETIKMNSIRVTRIGVKSVLRKAERIARLERDIIKENWDKDDDKECRKELYKAHRTLAKTRMVINECQRQLRATKLELRKLNRQHDIRVRAISSAS